jgi:heme-degrading monooxygenase HmoA
MILEHAVLDVIPGREAEFEQAFGVATPLISNMPGFVNLRLQRCIEQPSRYLLLVGWEQLTDHTEGFRQSQEFTQWRSLLHHFYDPAPTVEHFTEFVAV